MKLFKPSWINHEGHPIFSIDIHPDDTRFATGGQGDDSTGRVVIWNLKAVLTDTFDPSVPNLFCQLDHHSACVNCVRWSNSGRFLASGGDDKVIIVWKLVSKQPGTTNSMSSAFGKANIEQWKSVAILRNHEGDVLDLSWSPGDAYIASASIDNTVIIWDAQNLPQVIATLKGHSSMVKGVTWDPVGKYIATQSEDKTLRIWRTSDWKPEHIIKEPFSEVPRTCGGTTHVLRLGWSPDGLYLVSAHAMNCGGPTAQIIERDGWKTDKDFVGHRKAVVCVRFNKNIQEKNRVKQCCVAMGSRDRSISVWSTALKRPVVVVKDAFTHSVMDLTWSHCGTIMMACSWDGTVIATKFSWKEIGRPLSQEETVSLYHRFYGKSVVNKNCLTVIPNMEVYLARQEIMAKKVEVQQNSEIESSNEEKRILDQTPIIPIESPTKGPDRQIETRTADGKRRITPKFIPLSEADPCTTPVIREDAAVFQKPVKETSSHQPDNLRERMVSSIDDVLFDENKIIENSLGTANVKSSCPNPSEENAVEMTDITSEQANEGDSKLQNGVPSSLESISVTTDVDKETEVEKLNGVVAVRPLEVNGLHAGQAVSQEPPSAEETMMNGFGKDSTEDEMEGKSKPGMACQNNTEALKKRLADVREPMPIAVKRKRGNSDDNKPQPIMVKKGKNPTTPVPASMPKSNTVEISDRNVNVPEPIITQCKSSITQKSSNISKSRLLPMKIETVSSLQVNVKPDSGFMLEVTNCYKRTDGVVHQLKCKHLPSSLQGLEWTICTDAPICGISGDAYRIVVLCEDAMLHVLDIKGRYAFSPVLLSSYPSKMVQSGPFLLVVTTKAHLHLWNIYTKNFVIKSESLLPLLNQPGSDTDKVLDVAQVFLVGSGTPLVLLSNGKSFIFNKEMCSWMLFSDPNGLVSSPCMAEVGDTSIITSMALGPCRRKPEPALLSHIKLQFIKATEMKQPESIRQWVIVLSKTLATHGLEKELHILCEDLLGPSHSSAKLSSSWNPLIANCVEKRSLLREILTNLLEDLRWQDIFCEFDELLKELEDCNVTAVFNEKT